MATPSLLRKVGDTAKDAMKKYSPFPDNSDVEGLKAVQQNVNQATESANKPAPTMTQGPSTVERLHPQARYGDRPGEQRLDAEGNVIHAAGKLPVYDDGGDVSSNYQRIMSVPTGATNVGPQPISQFDDSSSGKRPSKDSTFNGGSVGGVSDPALATPQYMPGGEPAMAPPVVPVYDDGGDVKTNKTPSLISPEEEHEAPMHSEEEHKPSLIAPEEEHTAPMQYQEFPKESERVGKVSSTKNSKSERPVMHVYDDGGNVDVNDGNHQVAVLENGEKVLTPEQAAQYDQEHGAPADFGGRVIANPDNVRPHSDTEPLETERLYGGAKMSTDNASLKTPKGDTENARLGNPAAPEGLTESSVKSEGIKPRLNPNSPIGQMLQKDKMDAAQRGDLVGMGTALLNEKHLAPPVDEMHLPSNSFGSAPQGSAAMPALPVYGGPGKAVPQGQAIPDSQIHHDKIAAYDQRIQDALDKAAATNDPAYQEQADRLKVAKAQFEKNTPWGSPTNHPGILGEIGHVAAKVGNIAGDVVAPETMSLIPGTQLNKNVQANKLGSALSADTEANLRQQEEHYKENALEVGKTPEQRTYSYYIRQGYPPDKALEMTKGDEAKEKESYINDAMKQPNLTTGKPTTREEATQAYYQMRAGVKPVNQQEQTLQDYMQRRGLPDTPENRDLSRNEIEKRKIETQQEATLPYAEQKIRLQNGLAESKAELDRTGSDALARGKSADEFALKENERHNLRQSQIDAAQNALSSSDTNELAASITPVLATMTESNAQGIKRLNPQELAKFMPKSSGDAKQWFESHYDQLTAGQIPEQYRSNLKELLGNIDAEEKGQNQANLKAIDDTLRQGAVQPKVNEKGKPNSTEKSKPGANQIPTAQDNKYHLAGAKGEIVSNDGKVWYTLDGKQVGK